MPWIRVREIESFKLLDFCSLEVSVTKLPGYQARVRGEHVAEYFYKELVNVIVGCKEIITQHHYML